MRILRQQELTLSATYLTVQKWVSQVMAMDTVMVMGTVMDTDTVTMAIMERKTTDMEKDRSRKKRRNNATEYNNTGPIRPVYFPKK